MNLPRRLAALGTAAALLTVLAACSSTSGGGSSDASTAGTDGSFPTTVQTEFGAVTVTSSPKRVVALGWGDAETALALGVQPVGASDWLAFGGTGVGSWAAKKYSKAPTLIGTLSPSYEKIAALKPDLILDTKSSGDATRQQRLAQIATTVDVPKGATGYATTLDQQVTTIAAALGKQAEGKKLLAGVDSAFTTTAAAHPAFKGKTVTVASYTSAGWGAYTTTDARVKFMQRLGLTQNPKVAELGTSSFSVNISSEQLQLLDADVLIILPIGETASAVKASALYDTIPAVKDGHSVILGDTASLAFSDNTTLSTQYALDTVTPLVAKALGK